MLKKSRLGAWITRDHSSLAKLAEKEGRFAEAAGIYAKSGNMLKALELAARAGKHADAVRYSFQAVLGKEAEVPAGAKPKQAGEVLKAAGRLKEALLMFELGGAWGPAAQIAARLKEDLRAAKLYERARLWGMSASLYERMGRLRDAVRTLELEAKRLHGKGSELNLEVRGKLREVNARRAQLLAKLGEEKEAGRVVADQGPTKQAADLLERAGRHLEAFRAHVELRRMDDAYRVLRGIKGLEPENKARMLQRCGHTAEAAELLRQHRNFASAAKLFAQVQDWVCVAQCCEAAGQRREAAEAFQKAKRPRDAVRCYAGSGNPARAAEIAEGAGLISDAIELFLQAGMQERAGHGYLRQNQHLKAANCFLAAGATQQAIEALDRVPQGSRDFTDATVKLAPLLLEDGRLDEALHTVRRLSTDPRAVGAQALERFYWEGRVLEQLSQDHEASLLYAKLQALKPDHRDVTRRLANLTSTLRTSQGAGAALTNPTVGNAEPVSDLRLSDGIVAGEILVGRYELRRELARGGMGRVFEAFDRELDERVAIKTLLGPMSAGSDEEARLLREVQICRRITHPNIVRVYDVGRFAGGLFLTMELLEGQSLDSVLEMHGSLPFESVKSILAGVLAGLTAAHAEGVIHRDLKPGNVFLTDRRIKVLDFGIAHMKSQATRLTATGTAVGTPRYMSPEQIQGLDLDPRTDLYSLGVVAFTLIAGRCPFEGSTIAEISIHHLNTEPADLRSLRSETPAVWAGWVHQLLKKDREERPPSCNAAYESLKQLPA